MSRLIAALLLVLCPAIAAGAPTAMTSKAEIDPASAKILAESVRLIEEDRYCEALPYLEDLAETLPENADVFSMLGYIYRKMDDLELSAENYDRALRLDPNHLGALEYQGELFLRLGQNEQAAANLSRLTTLCGSCEEKVQLETAIRDYPSEGPKTESH
ncbi:MAG: tetratricopeptide repeat protein [Pseudomonadota bacterium]